jgi:phosphoenolpyruvate carboxykinase (ATP)
MKLGHTRAIIDAIHDGSLTQVPTREDPIFGLRIPTSCPRVPDDLLVPRNTWANPDEYDRTARRLASQFVDNFALYSNEAPARVHRAGPRL